MLTFTGVWGKVWDTSRPPKAQHVYWKGLKTQSVLYWQQGLICLLPVWVSEAQEHSRRLLSCAGTMADLSLWSPCSRLSTFTANAMLQTRKGQRVVLLWSSLVVSCSFVITGISEPQSAGYVTLCSVLIHLPSRLPQSSCAQALCWCCTCHKRPVSYCFQYDQLYSAP